MQIICNKKKFITYIVSILTKLKVTSVRQKKIHILALPTDADAKKCISFTLRKHTFA